MPEPTSALRGPTIRALLVRMGVVAAVLAAAIVAIRVVGQEISADRYHQAAIDEVGRIEPALGLQAAFTDEQVALQSYVATLEPEYKTAWANAYRAFFDQLPRVQAANGDAPEIEASLQRLERWSRAWAEADSRAILLALGRPGAATRLARRAADPLVKEQQTLMRLIHERRLAAVHDADRWASISYWLSNAAIALGGLVVMLFAALITRRVLRPLETLQAAATRIGQGIAGAAVPVPRRRDEIHELAVAFNAMEGDLGAARRQLEARAAELEQANRMKTDFVANVSHELRTPLSAIIGYSQLLLDPVHSTLGDREREDLGTILDSAEHLLVVINDLLDVSRIEAGRLEIWPLETDLRDVVRHACQAVEGQARGKGLALHCRLPDRPVAAVCDPDRVRQVLLHLLGNAVKFTDSGSIAVSAGLRGEWAEITVADTGIGIAEDQLPLIWRQFHQVDGSLTRRAGGTGLGLAITRQLVALHGGSIDCRSELGCGSTFTVRLPARRGSPRAEKLIAGEQLP